MISTTNLLIIGAIVAVAIVALFFVYKWWNKKSDTSPKTDINSTALVAQPTDSGPPSNVDIVTTTNATSSYDPPPPPMLFAVNDQGNLDLTDFDGKLLNSSYGPSPKTYIQLLDLASKDIVEQEGDNGQKLFTSNVGTTRGHEVGGHRYIINYTRLS